MPRVNPFTLNVANTFGKANPTAHPTAKVARKRKATKRRKG